jgi:two-component sensor histidine kinase
MVDVTDLKNAEGKIKDSLKEKEMLLREIHHRVKNNMQVILSLLSIQSKHVMSPDDAVLFRESQDRIRAMALVHEELYASKDLSHVDLREYVSNLTRYLFRSCNVDANRIFLATDVRDVDMGINTAIPCGLVINELVSNALKHAFPEGRKGEIRVSLTRPPGGDYELSVGDNGVGIPENLDFMSATTMGLQLVRGLVEQQLGGKIVLDGTSGTEFRISFREPVY